MKTAIAHAALAVLLALLMTSCGKDELAGPEGDQPVDPVEFLGACAFGACNILATVNDLVFIGNGFYLEVLDCSVPSSPVVLGRVLLPGAPVDAAIAGDHAYVTCGPRGLCAVRISDISNMQVLGRFYPQYSTLGSVARVDDYLFVGSSGEMAGTWIIDISQPTSPDYIRLLPQWGTDFEISGNYLYASCVNGVLVFDISNRADPTLVTQFFQGGAAWGLALQSEVLYIAADEAGLQLYDVAQPASPVEKGGCETNGNAAGVVIHDGHAYVADRGFGVSVVDVSDVNAPSVASEHGIAHDVYSRGFGHVLGNGILYVTNRAHRMIAFDLSVASEPQIIGEYGTPGRTTGLSLNDNLVYLVHASNQMRVLDVSSPGSPVELGACGTPGTPEAVDVGGGYSYTAEGEMGVSLINIIDPANPHLSSSYDTDGTAHDITYLDGYCYIADGNNGLVILDVTVPNAPSLAGHQTEIGNTHSLCVLGDIAYVAVSYGGFNLIDISDPRNPQHLGSASDPYLQQPIGIYVNGNDAYVPTSFGNAFVFSVTDPRDPFRLGILHTPGTSIIVGMSFCGEQRAAVSISGYGLGVADITFAAEPFIDNYGNNVPDPIGMEAAPDCGRAYVASRNGGLHVFKLDL